MVEIFYKEILFNKGKILTRVLFQSIGYIVINISALILNEIIILNFLGFNKNIRSNISSRSFLDAEGLSKGQEEELVVVSLEDGTEAEYTYSIQEE